MAFNQGILMEEQADYVSAEGFYREAISLNYYFFDAYARLAYLQHTMGYNEEAIATLESTKRVCD